MCYTVTTMNNEIDITLQNLLDCRITINDLTQSVNALNQSMSNVGGIFSDLSFTLDDIVRIRSQWRKAQSKPKREIKTKSFTII